MAKFQFSGYVFGLGIEKNDLSSLRFLSVLLLQSYAANSAMIHEFPNMNWVLSVVVVPIICSAAVLS